MGSRCDATDEKKAMEYLRGARPRTEKGKGEEGRHLCSDHIYYDERDCFPVVTHACVKAIRN